MTQVPRGRRPASPLLDQILAPGWLRQSFRRVRANHGMPGLDGVTIRHFERDLQVNLVALAEEVRTGAYHPDRLLRIDVQTGGKLRSLAIPPVRDRVLQRAVLDVLAPLCDPRFAPSSFGYRTGCGVRQAVDRVAELRRRGLVWVVDGDIEDCFGSFDHALLRRFVRGFVADPTVCALLDAWIAVSGGGRGIPLGAVVSPFFCNVYLHQLDVALGQRGLCSVRYADDFIVLCPNPARAGWALSATHEVLSSLHLRLNGRKTRIVSFEAGFSFLGVDFLGTGHSVPSRVATTGTEGRGDRGGR